MADSTNPSAATLEALVEARTQQLGRELAAAEARRAELERVTTELLRNQQLEQLGRLAGGVAHELNTPAQYATDAVAFGRDSLRDLLRLTGAYRSAVHRAVEQ